MTKTVAGKPFILQAMCNYIYSVKKNNKNIDNADNAYSCVFQASVVEGSGTHLDISTALPGDGVKIMCTPPP